MYNIIQFIILIILSNLAFTGKVLGQNTQKPKIYYVADLKSSKVNDYVQRNNLLKIQYLVDGKYLGKKNDFTFSKIELRKEVERIFPNSKATGYAYLDIEDPYMEIIIKENSKSQKFQKAQKLYLDVLAYAKQLRPNVKWGYYGIPFTTYWGRDRDFYNKNQKISAILKKVDVLYPSLYIFYNNVSFSLENSGYLRENTDEALKLGIQYDKDVIPFIMSRYHPSNQKRRFKQIDHGDFSDYVNSIVKPFSNGKSVNGIVLWNVDNYFYSINEPAILTDFKNSRTRNFDQYYENYLINQFQLIKNALNNIYGK